MLWEKFLTDCVTRIPTATSDGEGGSSTVWADGAAFTAAIIKNNDAVTRVAEKDTEQRFYTVTSATKLSFGDAFKRSSDGQTFRVTSNGADSEPPACASFHFYQMQAETWREPT